jgi:hypothetical protein
MSMTLELRFATAMLFFFLATLKDCGSFFDSCHNCPPKPPVDNSGSWSGSIQVPAFPVAATLIWRLWDKDANLSGTLQFAGTVCPDPLSVTGSVTGFQVYFQDTPGWNTSERKWLVERQWGQEYQRVCGWFPQERRSRLLDDQAVAIAQSRAVVDGSSARAVLGGSKQVPTPQTERSSAANAI